VAGGNINIAGGVSVHRVARWDGSSWSAIGAGTNNAVAALAAWPNGDFVAGGFYVLGNGPATSLFELAPFGWLFLHAPVIAFASGPLDPVTGRATHTIALPPNPSLIGLTTWFQALAGTCLSNVLRVEII